MEAFQNETRNIRAIVIGASAGGVAVLQTILRALPRDFSAAVMIVLHLHNHSNAEQTARSFALNGALPVKEAEDKELILAGTVYIAPANYHLLLERDLTFSLSIDEKVNFSRPSIDVLFETAAEAYQQALVGVLLSGASSDGIAGLQKIKQLGGLTIVQAPESAEFPLMPKSAIENCSIDAVLLPDEIASWLIAVVQARVADGKKSAALNGMTDR